MIYIDICISLIYTDICISEGTLARGAGCACCVARSRAIGFGDPPARLVRRGSRVQDVLPPIAPRPAALPPAWGRKPCIQ